MTCPIRIFKKFHLTPKIMLFALLKVKLPNMTDCHKKFRNSYNFGQKLFFFRVANMFQAVVEGASRYNVDHFNSNMVKYKKIFQLKRFLR